MYDGSYIRPDVVIIEVQPLNCSKNMTMLYKHCVISKKYQIQSKTHLTKTNKERGSRSLVVELLALYLKVRGSNSTRSAFLEISAE